MNAGSNASTYSSDEEAVYGIQDKLQCKLCEEAMKLVEREISRDSSKVNDFLKSQQIQYLTNGL